MFPLITLLLALEPSVPLPAPLDRVLRDYEQAWTAKNPAALAALFTEDGFVMARDHEMVRGRANIAKHYAGTGGPLFLRAVAFRTSGDTGYILGAYTDAANAPDRGKFTLTLRKEKERWLIFSDIDNGNQPPPARR